MTEDVLSTLIKFPNWSHAWNLDQFVMSVLNIVFLKNMYMTKSYTDESRLGPNSQNASSDKGLHSLQ